MATNAQTLDDVIGKNVRDRRKELGMSQEDLAEKLECSRHRVMQLEGMSKGQGRRPAFTWATLVALCYVLDVTLHQLVLPADSDTEIALTQTPGVPDLPAEAVSGMWEPLTRNAFGLSLFGLPGDVLLKAVMLEVFSDKITKEINARRDEWQEMLDELLAYVQATAEKYPGKTNREIDELERQREVEEGEE